MGNIKNRSLDGIDEEFLTAFADELDQGVESRRITTSLSRSNGGSTASRSPVSMPLRKVAEPAPLRLTDEEIDQELESVLRGLSAPAKPRDRIIVETQSFAPERAVEERASFAQHQDVDDFEELIRSELAVIHPSVAAPRQAARGSRTDAHRAASTFHDGNPQREPSIDEFDASSSRSGSAKRSGRGSRTLMVSASAAVLLLAGGVAFGLWSGGASGVVGGEPLLIKADAGPYKIQPKEPGGRAYPNQNKAVYERVASPDKDVDTPLQQALLHKTEEPMELPADDDGSNDLPGVEVGGDNYDIKDEARLTEMTGTAAETTLQPRKVRTLTVGPDGRLVENPATSESAKTDDAVQPAADPIVVAAVAPVGTAALSTPASLQGTPVVPTADPLQAATAAAAAPAIVTALPAGGYFVQIASQPSQEAAQQSLANMSKRYAGVLSGRAVGVTSADIPGKGTYYRVRVAAESKQEAQSVCSRLKSAGGTCFVSR